MFHSCFLRILSLCECPLSFFLCRPRRLSRSIRSASFSLACNACKSNSVSVSAFPASLYIVPVYGWEHRRTHTHIHGFSRRFVVIVVEIPIANTHTLTISALIRIRYTCIQRNSSAIRVSLTSSRTRHARGQHLTV